jgi:beta-N-acetylhexosaminidase
LTPASLNFDIVTKLLRYELGFRHLAITDDLEMGAITRHSSIEEAAKAAIRAGEDMILICSTVEAVQRSYRALLDAFQSGELKIEHLHDSLARIAEVKALLKPPLEFNADRFQELASEVAELNKTLNYSYGGKI